MKRLALACLILAVLAVPALALDTATRPVGPVRTWSEADLARFSQSGLQMKFVEGSNARLESGRFVDDSGLDVSAVNEVLSRETILDLRPSLDHDRTTLREWKRIAGIRAGVAGPDLSLWFDVRIAGGAAAIARLVNALNDLPAIEIAHPAAIPEPAVVPVVPGARILTAYADGPQGEALRTPDFTGRQRYLNDPPVGLNAPAAWALTGGMGAGEHFIDVELCWTLDHEEFDYSKMFYAGGAPMNPDFESHGTSVLGEIISQHNGFGVNGFAPDVEYGVVAVTLGEWPYVSSYFQEAIDHLSAGDVWLIELQMYPPGKDATPMEYLQANYDVIWTGVFARGIVCVEAGANGYQNLDDPSWNRIFDRTFRDSGAIMCAAGTPDGLVCEWFSNYGSRMDVHAWGSTITTTGNGDLYNGGTLQTRYTAIFSGTSGASPMATGSALDLEGIARANLFAPVDPIVLRRILTDTGTPHSGTLEIGPRPNLAAASQAVLALGGVPENGIDAAMRAFAFPNPFHSKAEILLPASSAHPARLLIFDAAGRRVRALAGGIDSPASQRFVWDGTDDAGRSLGSGVYFYRLDGAAGPSPSGRIEIIR